MFNCLVICHGQGKVIEYSDIELEHYFRFQIVCSTICVKYWLVNAFILNNNTSIVYISNLLQTCYIVLVNILVLVIIQSPFHLSVNTTHPSHYTPSNIEVRTLQHPSHYTLHTIRHRGSNPPTPITRHTTHHQT